MALFLGIDGGGSKTACVVGDETAILGLGLAGGSNLVRSKQTFVREQLHRAVQQACAVAKINPLQISRTCIGVAGAGRATIANKISAILSEVVGGEVAVTGDLDITLHAAFPGGPGVIVIAGTGSIAYGRNKADENARAGGWGSAISDEGSGYWVGQRAVCAAMRELDEGAFTPLLTEILKALEVTSISELVIAAPKLDFAKLFPTVLHLAESGDALALKILQQAGKELARMAMIVAGRLFIKGKTVRVAISGGVFRSSRVVRETFIANLGPHAKVRQGVVDPMLGALDMARYGI